MKKYKYFLSVLTVMMFSFTFVGCDEDAQIDGDDIRESVVEPAITSFSPSSGVAGTEIMIEGENLSSVDSIFIGNIPVTIKNKISNNKILAEVSAEAQTGKIRVRNPKGSAVTSTDFEVLFATPALTSVIPNVAGELTVGETATVKGTDMKSIARVLIADTEAKIIFASDTELRFIVPKVTAGISAKVVLQYLNGAEIESIESADSFVIKGSTLAPVVTECPTTAEIGAAITITGTNLDVATSALFNDISISFTSLTASEIKFTIPTSITSETKADLILVYNGTDQVVACKDFIVTVPALSDEVTFYGGLVLHAQDPEMTNQFFNVETGAFYSACDDYTTIKNNTSFFITWSDTNGTFQINNPNNSANQTPMFTCSEVALPTEKLPNVVKFKVLKTTTKAENEYINKVKTRTLGKISPQIIVDAGISNATTSAPRYNYNGINPSSPFEVGSVLMFQWYDPTGATVQKVGFIEIVAVNVPDDVKRKTTMTFNCYYQKD